MSVRLDHMDPNIRRTHLISHQMHMSNPHLMQDHLKLHTRTTSMKYQVSIPIPQDHLKTNIMTHLVMTHPQKTTPTAHL